MTDSPTYLLIDNGSRRPEATLQLRHLAEALGSRVRAKVFPVSLQHADKIPVEKLAGTPALVLSDFLRAKYAEGVDRFVAVPLFFGNSRALTSFIPDCVSKLAEEAIPVNVTVAEPLSPLQGVDERLAKILCDNARNAAVDAGIPLTDVVLVDHGSPVPKVTAVRNRLAEQMHEIFGTTVQLQEAVMERRPGPEYDFNGPLLMDLLTGMAEENPARTVVLAMMFLLPGRHAGPGGDVVEICQQVMTRFPGFQVIPSALVGEHPGVVDILAARLQACGAGLSRPT